MRGAGGRASGLRAGCEYGDKGTGGEDPLDGVLRCVTEGLEMRSDAEGGGSLE